MKTSHARKTLLATAAATLASAASAVVLALAGGTALAEGLTRAQVQAELADARAAGALEPAGEGSTPEAVLQARELFNQTQAQVIEARQALRAERLAQDEGAPRSVFADIATYVEQGGGGPVLLVIDLDTTGTVRQVRAFDIAAAAATPEVTR
jgi:hypothetical protein